jgi:hypothetical protein
MKTFFLILAMGIAASAHVYGQAHGHLNIGAVSTDLGAPLTFDNSNIFETNTAFVMTLNFTNGGTYAGYYHGNITLAALAQTASNGGPVPNAPALGSLEYAQIVSVEGPTGGAFGFWETGAIIPTINLPCGTINGTNTFKVSQNDGSPGTDPYGHIHGRRFTATKPGLYLVGFRAIDRSTNGVGGGPIHTASDVLKIYFQAGVNITSIAKDNGGTAVTFGAPGGKSCTLQALDALGTTNWIDLETITGADALQTLIDTQDSARKFYRIKAQ